MKKHFTGLFVFMAVLPALLLIGGCATLHPTDVNLCQEKRCNIVKSPAKRQELLGKLYNLLKNNLNRDIALYESDPKDRTKRKKGVGFYVQGGPIPGWSEVYYVKFTDILYIDRDNFEIKFKVDPKVTWNAMPFFTTETEGTLTVREDNEIKYSATYFGTWMVVGTSAWKHEMMFDYIDFDTNTLGSLFSIGGGGPLCVGSGSGYSLAVFPVGSSEQAGTAAITSTAVLPVTPAEKEKPLPPPALDFGMSLADRDGQSVLEGGREAVLELEIVNKGEGPARNVSVILSGDADLVGYFGEKHVAGDIRPGQRKTMVLRATLPAKIQTGKARIHGEIKEGKGLSPVQRKSIEVATRSAETTETVEVISRLPRLEFATRFEDQNRNRIIDGGESISLKVDVRNTGEGTAKDVQVLLSGHRELVSYLGGKRFIGDIKPGEQQTAEFKTTLPARIPSETANIRIEIAEAQGFASSRRKTLQIAMRPVETIETVEVISEVNVDDIPSKIKNYVRNDAVALVIGISKYREEAIPPVKYAARDAEVMAKYIENLGGVPRANIQVLTNEKASKSDIQAYLEDWLPRRVSEDSTVFLYYAGHGAPDPQGREAYLVPYEGQPDFPSKLYPLQNVYAALNKLPAKRVVVMLDSCFSGAKGRSVTQVGARPLVMHLDNILPANQKVIVVAGATGNQISSDYDRVKHGLFTYYLLRGLRGEADRNSKGVVNLEDLYQYVKKNVSEKASLELNRDQTPVLLPSESKISDQLKIPLVRTR
jgi:hypothetical protein